MNIANKLTLSRIILVFVFMLIIWSPFLSLEVSLWIGLAIFIIASITDYLDGYLARKYDLVTNLGKFMDPLADKMLVTVAMIAIVDKGPLPVGTLPAWIVVVILLREFAVSGIRMLAATNQVVIAASSIAKLKTVMQMVMIILFLIPIDSPVLRIAAIVFSYTALILTIISGLQYIWLNRNVFVENK